VERQDVAAWLPPDPRGSGRFLSVIVHGRCGLVACLLQSIIDNVD